MNDNQKESVIPHSRHLYYWNENYHLYEYYSTIRGERYRLVDGNFGQHVSGSAGKLTAQQVDQIYNKGYTG